MMRDGGVEKDIREEKTVGRQRNVEEWNGDRGTGKKEYAKAN